MNFTADEVKQKALKELEDEQFRAEVDAVKDRLREARKRWFPWKIILTIKRRE